MKILHTADWHLGRYFKNYSLLEDQKQVLGQFIDYARQERPDLILLAGDIYDRSVPGADAVALLDETLATIILELKIPMIAIAGNHDNSERVAYCQGMLQKQGLYMVGNPEAAPKVLRFEDKFGEIFFYPLPYTTPEVLRMLLFQAGIGGYEIQSHEDVMNYYTEQIKKKHPPSKRAVLIAHAFIGRGLESKSERSLTGAGGASQIPAELFADFDYVALGHLHRPQQFLGGKLHYAGSLLQYSLSESDHEKSLTLVEIDGQGKASLQILPLEANRKIVRIGGSIENQQLIVNEEDQGKARPQDFVELTLYNDRPVLNAMSIVQKTFPNAVAVQLHEQYRTHGKNKHPDLQQLLEKAPEDIFEDFYKIVLQKNEGLPLEAKALLLQTLQQMTCS